MSNTKKTNEHNSSAFEKIAESSVIGGSQIFIIFALTHPLDLMKTKMQADIHAKLTSKQHAKLIYSKNGLAGFYKAGVPNFTRAFTKELYRSSLRGFFNKLYSDSLPKSLKNNYPDVKNLLTGITMSTADTILSSPLERIKVWLMTHHESQSSIFHFFEKTQSVGSLFKHLFSGLSAMFYRNTISWVSFLVIEERIRNKVISTKNLNPQSISIMDQLIIGSLSGALNSLITLPFDSVKTQIQKMDNIKTKGIFKTMRYIVDTKGISGLYSGWQFRLPSYIIVAIITSSNIQRIDKIWNDQVLH